MNFIPIIVVAAGALYAQYLNENTKPPGGLTSDYKSLHKIVENVISEKRKETPKHWKNKVPIIKPPLAVAYHNPKRELNDLATNTIVKYFTSGDEYILQFMDLVNSIYVSTFDVYKKARKLPPTSVTFLYKGGNVMRIVAKEFLIELPGTVSRPIEEHYNRYFKRSDADFAIYVDTKLKNYDEIFSEITDLTYRIARFIRTRIKENPRKYFLYFNFHKTKRDEILNKLLSTLNESDSLGQDETNIDFFGGHFKSVGFIDDIVSADAHTNDKCLRSSQSRAGGSKFTDMRIMFKNEDPKDKIYLYSIDDIPRDLYLQYNTALDFTQNEKRRKFNLIRLKALFEGKFVSSVGDETPVYLGGELIDIGIPHKLSTGLSDFFAHFQENVSTYRLKSGEKHIHFRGYSLDYIVKDLEDVLYIQNNEPWEDKKYQKRLSRSCYFYYVDLFIKMNNNKLRREFLENFLKYILLPIQKTRSLQSPSFRKKIKQRIHKFYKKYQKYDLMYIHSKHNTSLLDAIKKHMMTNNQSDFLKFISIVIENINVVSNALSQLDVFCSVDGLSIKRSDLYNKEIYP